MTRRRWYMETKGVEDPGHACCVWESVPSKEGRAVGIIIPFAPTNKRNAALSLSKLSFRLLQPMGRCGHGLAATSSSATSIHWSLHTCRHSPQLVHLDQYVRCTYIYMYPHPLSNLFLSLLVLFFIISLISSCNITRTVQPPIQLTALQPVFPASLPFLLPPCSAFTPQILDSATQRPLAFQCLYDLRLSQWWH
jgi:hypothetical protein